MKLTLLYRPEREEPARSGSRFIYNTLVNPGLNTFENESRIADLEKYLETEEGKEQVKKTIFEVTQIHFHEKTIYFIIPSTIFIWL